MRTILALTKSPGREFSAKSRFIATALGIIGPLPLGTKVAALATLSTLLTGLRRVSLKRPRRPNGPVGTALLAALEIFRLAGRTAAKATAVAGLAAGLRLVGIMLLELTVTLAGDTPGNGLLAFAAVGLAVPVLLGLIRPDRPAVDRGRATLVAAVAAITAALGTLAPFSTVGALGAAAVAGTGALLLAKARPVRLGSETARLALAIFFTPAKALAATEAFGAAEAAAFAVTCTGPVRSLFSFAKFTAASKGPVRSWAAKGPIGSRTAECAVRRWPAHAGPRRGIAAAFTAPLSAPLATTARRPARARPLTLTASAETAGTARIAPAATVRCIF